MMTMPNFLFFHDVKFVCMFVSSPTNTTCYCAHAPAVLVLLPVDQCSCWSCLVSQCTATPAYSSIYRYCTCTVAAMFRVHSPFSGFVQWQAFHLGTKIKYIQAWGICFYETMASVHLQLHTYTTIDQRFLSPLKSIVFKSPKLTRNMNQLVY